VEAVNVNQPQVKRTQTLNSLIFLKSLWYTTRSALRLCVRPHRTYIVPRVFKEFRKLFNSQGISC
jgi:hypothetical protein